MSQGSTCLNTHTELLVQNKGKRKATGMPRQAGIVANDLKSMLSEIRG